MNKPDWFLIVDHWKSEGMGDNGVTLPFIIGALAIKSGRITLTPRELLAGMIEHPVDGCVVLISWCSFIEAPVLSIWTDETARTMKPEIAFNRPSGEGASLAIGINLISHWNCNDPQIILQRIIDDANKPVLEQRFSRRCKPGSSEYEYGDFSPKEIDYIRRVLHA